MELPKWLRYLISISVAAIVVGEVVTYFQSKNNHARQNLCVLKIKLETVNLRVMLARKESEPAQKAEADILKQIEVIDRRIDECIAE